MAFPALFSIVNPIAGAIIFRQVTAGRSHPERIDLARKVAVFSLLVMLFALWAGSYVLAFFGVTLAALRIAGGIVVALYAWGLLSAPENRAARKQEQAAKAEDAEDVAFFPLTMPFTTGPGAISVAVALGAGHPAEKSWRFFVGVSLAAIALAATIWLAYRSADRLATLLGHSGEKTVTRLTAFLLLCIGVQILTDGVTAVLRPLLLLRP